MFVFLFWLLYRTLIWCMSQRPRVLYIARFNCDSFSFFSWIFSMLAVNLSKAVQVSACVTQVCQNTFDCPVEFILSALSVFLANRTHPPKKHIAKYVDNTSPSFCLLSVQLLFCQSVDCPKTVLNDLIYRATVLQRGWWVRTVSVCCKGIAVITGICAPYLSFQGMGDPAIKSPTFGS